MLLLNKIKDKTANVTIIGLGYVGLPLAVESGKADYSVTGIDLKFGKKGKQVQYHSKHIIELIDIWFRRNSLKLSYSRGLYLRKYTPVPHLINLTFAILFHISFGRISIIDGWMGLYKKIKS